MNFIDKKVSTKQAMEILAHHDLQVDNDEADVILDFLYLMSKNHNETKETENTRTLKENRTTEEMC